MNEPSAAIPPPPPAATASPGSAGSKTAAERAAAHAGAGKEGKGPSKLPLVGNIPQISREGMLKFLMRSWRKYGDTFRVNLPGPAVIVAHPDGIQRVLAGNADNYFKGDAYNGLRAVVGDGIIGLNGGEWRKRRTLIQPKFHRHSLEGLVDIMTGRGVAFMDAMRDRLPDGGVVDVHDEMVKMTLDIVVNALFGRGLENMADVNPASLGLAIEMVSDQVNGVPVPKWLPTPKNIKFRAALREVNDAVGRIIEAARARGESEDKEDTLLQMLLDARDADTGEALTAQEIRDEVFTLFIAGHETTALTLTWLFALIDGEDEVKRRLTEEVDRVLGDRPPTFADLKDLTYTRQVIDETLRLRGPAPMVGRNAIGDDNICGVKVHAGDMIMPFIWAVHRHPDFWDDPEKFDPERFTPEAIAARDKWAYLPFSGGSRVCIGNTFSLYESTLLLALMVQRFEAELVPGQDLEPVMVATVRPRGGVKVRLRWR